MKINSLEFTDDVRDVDKTVTKFTEFIIETAEQKIGYLKPSSKKTLVRDGTMKLNTIYH